MVVFAANAVMVILGIESWPGLVTQNHYQKGLQYNQVISAQKNQDKLGWSVTLAAESLRAGQPSPLSLHLTDPNNQPVQHAQIEGILFRPLGEGLDLSFLLLEKQPGHYMTMLTPPKPGVWDVKIRARKTAAIDFRYVQRITVANP